MKRREEIDKYRDMGQEELRAEAVRLRESLFRLKFKLALGEVDAVFQGEVLPLPGKKGVSALQRQLG